MDRSLNRQDLEALFEMYGGDVELRSAFAKVYAGEGIVRSKPSLREYGG